MFCLFCCCCCDKADDDKEQDRYYYYESGRCVEGWHKIWLWWPRSVYEVFGKHELRWMRYVYRGWYRDPWQIIDRWQNNKVVEEGDNGSWFYMMNPYADAPKEAKSMNAWERLLGLQKANTPRIHALR